MEWKKRLPLGTAPARVHLVKHILGFANRPPEVAARWAEGHAYLLVGVSPGEVHGVTTIDHNELEQDLKPFIGPDLVWHPEYVKLDGKDVLIVVVDPPKYGDPIHFLRKPLPSPDGKGHVHPEHWVFIRRNAQTVKAEPGDWQMLQQRFAASQNVLDVEVVPMRQLIERLADFPEHVIAQFERHRERIADTSRRSGPGFFQVLASYEDRTREEYLADVAEYLKKLEYCLGKRLQDEWARHAPGGLSLALVNRVDRPFRDVRVIATLEIDGELHCLDPVEDDLPTFRPPRPPRAYGTPAELLPAPWARHPRGGYDPAALRRYTQEALCGWEVRETPSGLCIEFRAEDLRPKETLELPHVPLLLVAEIGAELTVQWTAAGLDADGERRRDFTLPVAPSTLDPMTGEDLGMWGRTSDDQEEESEASEAE
ncbi:AlbA family DNA-binding domain-containing protein [Actinomadura sp. 3N407]|uniref:AlbA family DNA-binding domain-containing protein n=1 Tax=Actinomadura sp. 3N407 TaxID=3457423 RepID=UPI003FCED524